MNGRTPDKSSGGSSGPGGSREKQDTLKRYRDKRHFTRTAEPRSAVGAAEGAPAVTAARRGCWGRRGTSGLHPKPYT